MLLGARAVAAQEFFGIDLDQPLRADQCPERLHDYVPDDRSLCFKADAKPSDGSLTVAYESVRADWNSPGGISVCFNSSEFGAFDGLVRIQARVATPQARWCLGLTAQA